MRAVGYATVRGVSILVAVSNSPTVPFTDARGSAAVVAQRKVDNPDKIGRRWAGGNQLWGDGRVIWAPAEKFRRDLMAPLDGGSYSGMPYTPCAPPIAVGFRWYRYPFEAPFWPGRDQ